MPNFWTRGPLAAFNRSHSQAASSTIRSISRIGAAAAIAAYGALSVSSTFAAATAEPAAALSITSGFTPARPVRLVAEDERAAVQGGEKTLAFAALALTSGQPESGVPEKPLPEPQGELFETGIASTYGTGDGFQGNLTACGQVFDTYVVQVAHKTLPCGTLVRVEDAETGKSVTVEVTDRGPYIAGRVVDLSWAAFQVLDPTAPGLRPVKVYLVK